MLNFVGPAASQTCDGATRRNFLKAGALGLTGLGLADLLRARSQARDGASRSGAVTPQDLMATLFHVLGLDLDLHYTDPAGRPTPMLVSGRPIRELVG